MTTTVRSTFGNASVVGILASKLCSSNSNSLMLGSKKTRSCERSQIEPRHPEVNTDRY